MNLIALSIQAKYFLTNFMFFNLLVFIFEIILLLHCYFYISKFLFYQLTSQYLLMKQDTAKKSLIIF
jgi:hypothetical protein